MTAKIVTVVGARPQFIKAAAVSRVIRESYASKLEEVLVHTGQHYDENMSKVFFDELDIPHPKYNLQISGGQHGAMTGRMLEAIENVLLKEKPDWVLIYGDTNSTLAAALAAVKLHIRVAHVEAGLRSFNMKMPEEINRILSDRVSSLLFCPTESAVSNLGKEGFEQGIHNVGDVMYDVALFYRARAREQSQIIQSLGLTSGNFALATCHRAENTDDAQRLGGILEALGEISNILPVVFPLHPRTKKLIENYGYSQFLDQLVVTDPLSFLDMVALEQSAKIILTDSGGVQKEAFFYEIPCVTMRDETEWVETIHCGANILVGSNREKILKAVNHILNNELIPSFTGSPYGQGSAAKKIMKILASSVPP
jgi:UDP-GlcNAc3NAcA epimerase